MENIYEVLEKHFQEQTSEKQELMVKKFRLNNKREYFLLKQLWHSNSKIEVSDYDSKKAWMEVLARAKQPNSHSIPIYTKLRQVAAVALIVIVSSLFAYFVLKQMKINPAMIEMATFEHQTDSVLLADGSIVWLNQNSKLYYPQKFKSKTRTVKLEGEAYFVVSKNAEIPFKVETQHSTITVLGTTFNVFTDTLQTEINLQSGKVNVQSAYTRSSIDLLPNYKAVAGKTSFTKSTISNPNYLSWKTGVFVFENTPLEKVVHDLNRFYKHQIVLIDPKPEQQFTARFNNAKLNDVLEILSLTCNLSIKEINQTYEIR
jgi:transmembrane sensor